MTICQNSWICVISTLYRRKKNGGGCVFRFFSKSILRLRYHPIRFELDSNSPPALLDSCYYNLFHGTSNLIMGPIYYIFPKICSIYLFFYIPPDMMNPIIIISVFLRSLFIYIYKQANFVLPWWWFELFAPPPTCLLLYLEILFLFF